MVDVLDLKDTTIKSLKDLVRVNMDSGKGLAAAADTVESESLTTLLRSISKQRMENAEELRSVVEMSDEECNDVGSIGGTLHRWWLECRGKLNGGDDKVVLIEAERGEDIIKDRYERFLKETPGTEVEPVIRRQYEGVKKGHDGIRDLRDAKLNA